MDRFSTGTSHEIGEENRKGERDYLTRIDIDRDVVSGAGLGRMREEGRTQPSMRDCTMNVNMHAEGAYLFFKGFFFFFFFFFVVVGSKEKRSCRAEHISACRMSFGNGNHRAKTQRQCNGSMDFISFLPTAKYRDQARW